MLVTQTYSPEIKYQKTGHGATEQTGATGQRIVLPLWLVLIFAFTWVTLPSHLAPAWAEDKQVRGAYMGTKTQPSNRQMSGLSSAHQALRQAIEDYRSRRIDRAMPSLEYAARHGSFLAKYLLAHIYQNGKYIQVDPVKAYDYYRQVTAKLSDYELHSSPKRPYVAKAYVEIGRYLRAGIPEIELKPNMRKAYRQFEIAAHLGNSDGQYELGRLLIETGIKGKIKLGERWVNRAAKKNNGDAQFYLSRLYWNGKVIKSKQTVALAWIEFGRRNLTGASQRKANSFYRKLREDSTEQQRQHAEFIIAHLRNTYKVLLRAVPKNQQEDEDKLLDGIIVADPPEAFSGEVAGTGNDPLKAPQYVRPDSRNMQTGPIFGGGRGGTGFGFQQFLEGNGLGYAPENGFLTRQNEIMAPERKDQ